MMASILNAAVPPATKQHDDANLVPNHWDGGLCLAHLLLFTLRKVLNEIPPKYKSFIPTGSCEL